MKRAAWRQVRCSLRVALALIALTTGSAQGRWYEYADCALIANDANDGDSFHVKTRSRRYLFRLYFVDAPETDESIPGRVEEQAAHWGISVKQALAIGERARVFTAETLAAGFTAHSQREEARGRSRTQRYFAMIEVDKRKLSELLVENGLARVYGKSTDLPDGSSLRMYIKRLEALEREAKREGRGAWGVAAETKTPVARTSSLRRGARLLAAPLPVYTLDRRRRLIVTLPEGARVNVRGMHGDLMVKLTFQHEGKKTTAQCRRADLD